MIPRFAEQAAVQLLDAIQKREAAGVRGVYPSQADWVVRLMEACFSRFTYWCAVGLLLERGDLRPVDPDDPEDMRGVAPRQAWREWPVVLAGPVSR